jgi:class 3 adenylate cyclase
MAGLATRFVESVFQRFPDKLLERRYRAEQRTGQAAYTSWAIILALAGLLIYWAISFVSLGPGLALGIVAKQAVFVPVLGAFAWGLRQPLYADAWWLDMLLFALILPFLVASNDNILSTQMTGWTFPGLVTYGFQSTLACACLAFAASVRPFAFLTLGSIAFLGAVLALRGYPAAVVGYTVFNFAFFAVVVLFLNAVIDRKARAAFLATANLAAEREKSERLLVNMLPIQVAERLKSQQTIADKFDDVVVVFVDLVGFTPLSQQLGPARIVELLNAFFNCADRGTDLFELEKVKTIGDAYMAVTNAITRPPRPHKAAIDFAVWLRGQAREVGRSFGVDLRLHVGVASGPAIGGVISAKRLSYDYWGHTVNLAARLQDSVGADGIAVSEPVWREVRDSYRFSESRMVALKGVGATKVYDVHLPM